VQQAPERGSDGSGSRGVAVVPLPAPAPRGLFRTGGGL
jgi:hypothetical protein